MSIGNERYEYRAPGAHLSCQVDYDQEQGCYVASSMEGFVGTGDDRHTAALACFEAWLTNRRAYYRPQTGAAL